MPEHSYDCPYCSCEGDMEFYDYVCQVNEDKRVCKDTSLCPYFISLKNV